MDWIRQALNHQPHQPATCPIALSPILWRRPAILPPITSSTTSKPTHQQLAASIQQRRVDSRTMEEAKDSSQQQEVVEKSEVWTDEEFEAFIDTELRKDPLHIDYPDLFARGAFCVLCCCVYLVFSY